MWWLLLWVNLTGLRDAQLGKHYFWVCLCGQEISIRSVHWVRKITLIDEGGHHPVPSAEGLTGTKGGGRVICQLPELGHPSFPVLAHPCSWFLGFQTWPESYTLAPPYSQAFGFGLEFHHQRSWASDSQNNKSWNLLIHNCVSQSLIVNLLLLIIYIP